MSHRGSIRIFTPTLMGEKPFYVYTLAYPNGFLDEDGTDLSDVVFYVGKGTIASADNVQRVDTHEQEARIETSYDEFLSEKCKAIRRIWKKLMNVKKQVVFDSEDEQEVLAFEKQLIKRLTGPYLTNGTYNKLSPHHWYRTKEGQAQKLREMSERAERDRKNHYLRLKYALERGFKLNEYEARIFAELRKIYD